jgi:AcrR family transcriptional regulator
LQAVATSASQPTDKPGHNQGRQALLDAAITVVAQRGLRGLTYRAVAKAARLSYGLVSHHFGSRDALISEALASTVDTLERATIDRPGGIEDFAGELAAFISENEDLLAFQYELTMEARRRPELSPDIQKMYTDVLETMRTRFGEFGLPDDEAFTWFALAAIDGMILQQVVFGREEQTRASVRMLQEVIAQRRAAA